VSWALWLACLTLTFEISESRQVAIYVLGSICYGGFCMLLRK
jgi:hypothetical protein